jgi:phosphatidate cytidylyltransferase
VAADSSTPPSSKFADFRLRLISSVVVSAVAFACIWFGGIWIALLAAVAAALMMMEWRSITRWKGERAGLDALMFVGAVAAAAILAHAVGTKAAIVCLVIAAASGLVLDWFSDSDSKAGNWAIVGALYIGGAAIALVALRGAEPYGFLSILWAGLVVIAADVGGYFAGRIFGGAKLWPAVSPKKTWSGLFGGIALAFLVGGVFSWATTGTYFYQVCAVSAVAALLAQGGDLAESALKRHFGVKDAGSILPGHGGVLDRLDGHMAAVLVAAAVTFYRDQAVFIW